MKTSINIKKGFTLVEILVVITLIGILAAIVIVSLQNAKKNARLASFQTSMTSLNTAAMTCADSSLLNLNAGGAGDDICSSTAIDDSVYPTLESGTCDNNTYSVSATDETSADSIYQVAASCSISGTNHTVTCDQNKCTKT